MLIWDRTSLQGHQQQFSLKCEFITDSFVRFSKTLGHIAFLKIIADLFFGTQNDIHIYQSEKNKGNDTLGAPAKYLQYWLTNFSSLSVMYHLHVLNTQKI